MRYPTSTLCAMVALCLASSGAGAGIEPPTPVFPAGDRPVEIAQRCPTFSWGAVAGAAAFELVVFRAPSGTEAEGTGRHRSARAPEIRAVIPTAATSWTPSLDQCLDLGEEYVWYVREVDPYGNFVGDWSTAQTFRVVESLEAPPAAPPSHGGPDEAPGYGTGGIPAVLAELESLRQQIDADHAAIRQRLDEVEQRIVTEHAFLNARIDDVDSDLFAHHESSLPCTPQRWRDGKCDILEVEATVCFHVGLEAVLGAEFALEPGYELAVGASWHEVPHVEFKVGLETPAFTTIPPTAFPDLKAGIGAGADGGVEICIANLTFPLGPEERTSGAETFLANLVQAIEARAGEISDRVGDLLEERGLDGSRIVDTLDALRELRGGGVEISDPMNILREGHIRDFIDTLPVDSRMATLVDDPRSLLPGFDGDNPLALCEDVTGSNLLDGNADRICAFTDAMPDLNELADTVTNLPLEVRDRLCETIPALDCEGDVRACRSNCRQDARACKNSCGLFQFRCRRNCEQTKDACIAGC